MTRASAPASSANLGPGFDVLALALDLRLSVVAEPAQGWEIVGEGDVSTLPMIEAMGLPPMHVEITSDVPVGRGLGSSAALRAAIAAAALAVGGEVSRDEVFRRVAAAEGHADNAAAAVYGGLMAVGSDGSTMSLAVHPSLLVVVAVRAYPVSTERAREALPGGVQRAVAVRTAARLTFLVEGLRTADPAALAAAAGDEIHEEPRTSLSPLSGELVRVARTAGALHASWSGAGPAVVAFATEETVDRISAALAAALDGEGEVLEPEVDRIGIVVEP